MENTWSQMRHAHNVRKQWDKYSVHTDESNTATVDLLPIHIQQTARDVVVTVLVPFAEQKDIAVTVRGLHLHIDVQVVVEHEIKTLGKNSVRKTQQQLVNTVPLPCAVDQQTMRTQFVNGVLEVTLRKAL